MKDKDKEIRAILQIMKKIEQSFYLSMSMALQMIEAKYQDDGDRVRAIKNIDEEYGKIVKSVEQRLEDGMDRLMVYLYFCSVTWTIVDKLYRQRLEALGHKAPGVPLVEKLGGKPTETVN